MLYEQDPKQPSRGEQIAIAVAIAGLSTLVSGLVNWGIQELQSKYGSKPEKDKQSASLQGSGENPKT